MPPSNVHARTNSPFPFHIAGWAVCLTIVVFAVFIFIAAFSCMCDKCVQVEKPDDPCCKGCCKCNFTRDCCCGCASRRVASRLNFFCLSNPYPLECCFLKSSAFLCFHFFFPLRIPYLPALCPGPSGMII
jgi:hypothetical protein